MRRVEGASVWRRHGRRAYVLEAVVRVVSPARCVSRCVSLGVCLWRVVSRRRLLEKFLVRGDGEPIFAYENYCPHAGGPLNLLPNRFLSRDKQHLLCATHGAKFNIDDGVCVRGPCQGDCLNPLPVNVDAAAGVVATSEDSLVELCARGGGAFVEVPTIDAPT